MEAVISQMELNLSFEQPVSEDAEQNVTEESRDLLFQQLLAGRDKAEKWLSTLAYVAGCDAQVDEVFKASTQFFDSLPKKQATLHSLFRRQLMNFGLGSDLLIGGIILGVF